MAEGRDEIAAEVRDRGSVIVRTSIIGIAANVLLAAFKAVVGTLSNSIAITLDSVNNLSDAMSSVITIVGTKLAGKAPDKKHPFGYGRIEYLSAMIISVIVLYAGITSFAESIEKIIKPDTPDYSTAAIIIVAAAVVVKILLGLYVRATGRRVNSDSLVNSGQDALMDSVISAATLVSAIIFIMSGFSLEAYLGLIISIVIIKSGIEMLKDTISHILGERVDKELSGSIKRAVAAHVGVMGAFDLVMNNYGPDTYLASLHIEVAEGMTASEIDRLTREISADIYQRFGVLTAAIGIYSTNTGDKEALNVLQKIRKITGAHKEIIQTHGFYLDHEAGSVSFDVIFDYETPDREGLYARVLDEIQEALPDYKVHMALDFDISD